jgi:hypothetical protein
MSKKYREGAEDARKVVGVARRDLPEPRLVVRQNRRSDTLPAPARVDMSLRPIRSHAIGRQDPRNRPVAHHLSANGRDHEIIDGVVVGARSQQPAGHSSFAAALVNSVGDIGRVVDSNELG